MSSGEFLPKVKEALGMLQNLAKEDKDNRGLIVLACDWSADEGSCIMSSSATLENIAKLFSLLLKDEDMKNALRLALMIDGLSDIVKKMRSDESKKSKGDFTCDEPQPQEACDEPQRGNFSSNS